MLRLQRCSSCGHLRYPISTICPKCLSTEAEWEQVTGDGEIFTFVVFRHVYNEAWRDRVPYVVALVRLVEGPTLIGNVAGIDPETVAVGMPVRVVFERVDDEITLPGFARAWDRRMKLGVILPTIGNGAGPESLDAAAETASRLGWSSVWATDHLLVPAGPEADEYGWVLEATSALTWTAARFPDLRAGFSVIIPAMRDAPLLAKQLATIDFLTGGRLTVGVGASDSHDLPEYENLGKADRFKRRGAYLDESIALWRHLWSGSTDALRRGVPQRARLQLPAAAATGRRAPDLVRRPQRPGAPQGRASSPTAITPLRPGPRTCWPARRGSPSWRERQAGPPRRSPFASECASASARWRCTASTASPIR